MAVSHLWNYLPSVIIFQIFGNLSTQDRLRASSTCKFWRQCIYHSQVWPSSKIVINISKEVKQLYQIRRHHNNNNNNSITTKDYDQRRALKIFISRCGRFMQDITFIFNPSCFINVNYLIDVMNLLVFNYDDMNNNINFDKVKNIITNNNNNKNNNNCQRLSRITLMPTTTQIGSQTHIYCAMTRLLSSIEMLISQCPRLEHIGLGCIQQLLNHSPSLLTQLAQYHSNAIKCLHLASIKEDPDYYPVLELPVRLFEPFTLLKTLSIDFDNVSDDLLVSLSMRHTLERLIINVHGIDDEHQGVLKSSWSQLARSNSKLQVIVNLVHTDDSYDQLKDMIFDTDMPLAHFRAYYAGLANGTGEGICDLINLIAAKHSYTLLSATLVHHLKQFTNMPNTAFTRSPENPLVMLAWRCKKLQHLTVIGFEVSDADLIAITRLRSSKLLELNIPSCCISLFQSPISEDEGYYDDDKFYLEQAHPSVKRKIIEDIAKPLNRTWSPMHFDELPKAVKNRYDHPESTYLSTLLSDQAW